MEALSLNRELNRGFCSSLGQRGDRGTQEVSLMGSRSGAGRGDGDRPVRQLRGRQSPFWVKNSTRVVETSHLRVSVSSDPTGPQSPRGAPGSLVSEALKHPGRKAELCHLSVASTDKETLLWLAHLSPAPLKKPPFRTCQVSIS